MAILILLAAIIAQVVVSTASLALGLYLTGEVLDQEDYLKCLGVTVAALVMAMVPVLGFLSVFVWMAAVISVFEKSWLEALIIAAVCFAMRLGLLLVFAMLQGGVA